MYISLLRVRGHRSTFVIIEEEIVSAKIVSRGSVLSRVNRLKFRVYALLHAFHEIVTLNSQRSSTSETVPVVIRLTDYLCARSSFRDCIPIF